MFGNLFAQSLYGPPSTAFWAVQIAPRHRIAGYQDFGTFQPLFLYEGIWNVAVGVALIRLIARLNLTGDRALAICVGGYAVGLLTAEPFVVTGPQHHAVLLYKEIAAVAVLAGAIAYFFATRARIGPEPIAVAPGRGGAATRAGRGGRGGPRFRSGADRHCRPAMTPSRARTPRALLVKLPVTSRDSRSVT